MGGGGCEITPLLETDSCDCTETRTSDVSSQKGQKRWGGVTKWL